MQPIAPQKKFAFLIHFRNEIRDDLKLYWKPLKLMPEKFYRNMFYRYTFPSTKWSVVKNRETNVEFGRNEIIPLNPEMFFEMGFDKVTKRINMVIDKMVEKGYDIVGLGALTSPLTLGGKMFEKRTDISITNGNAFTAVILHQAVRKLTDMNAALAHKQAVVGATGSVGSCLARLIAKEGKVKSLLLVARNMAKLNRLKNELQSINPELELAISNDIQDIRTCDMVNLLTASADNLIEPEYLKQDAVILDGTQPRNTSPELLTVRPDVTVIDGGISFVSGIQLDKGGFGLPEHHYFACFSETALLAIDGHKGHFCLGEPSLEQAEFIEGLAQKHKDYGFKLSPFISFGEPLKDSVYAG